MDAAGNVSVATIQTGGISTFTPDGEELEFFAVDDPICTNICFGGADMKTAYITLSGTGTLIQAEWPRAGLTLPF
jgi:gluconolactonase